MTLPPTDQASQQLEEAMALELLTQFRGKPVRAQGQGVGRHAERWLQDLSGEKTSVSATAILRKLQMRWPEIVGQRLAGVCFPDRIAAGTVTLKCLPAAAPMLSASSGELVGVIRLAGFGAVRGLRLVHVPKAAFDAALAGSSGSKPARRNRPKPLSPVQQQAFGETLAKVDDPHLRQAMVRLAEAINGVAD